MSHTYCVLVGQTRGCPFGCRMKKHWTYVPASGPGHIPCSLAWHFSCKSLQAALQGPSSIISSTTPTYSYHTHGVMQGWAIFTKSLQQHRGKRSSPILARSWMSGGAAFQCSDPQTWMHLCWPACKLQRLSTSEVQPKSVYTDRKAPDFP